MLNETLVELACWQFALSAMLHFLFIPLVLGLSLWLAVLETRQAGKELPSVLAQIEFWRPIFSLFFIMALLTRLVVIFQFGADGSYFSHYVGDVFALPLAIEAMTGLFVAALMFTPYSMRYRNLGKSARLAFIWLLALSSHVSAYWILVSNAWMQNPVGVVFDPAAYRLTLTDFSLLLGNTLVIGKYLHTLAASHSAAAATVVAISALRLLRNKHDVLAGSGFGWAAGWGVVAMIAVVAAQDRTPDLDTPVQRAKLAAISSLGDPSLLADIESHIHGGIEAYRALMALRDDNPTPEQQASFAQHQTNLGYALLLQRATKHIVDAKPAQISQTAGSALPAYPRLIYWLYRLMIACGVVSLLGFAALVWQRWRLSPLPDWALWLGLYLAPLPWLACISGWFISEAGIQPWAVAGMLPTFAAVSSLTTSQVLISALAYATLYGLLLAITGISLRRLLDGANPLQGNAL